MQTLPSTHFTEITLYEPQDAMTGLEISDFVSPRPAKENNTTASFGEGQEQYSILGCLDLLSSDSGSNTLDWALIRIDVPDIFCKFGERSCTPRVINVARSISEATEVHVMTASNGLTTALMARSPTYVQLAHSILFQETWTVDLQGMVLRE